MSYTLTQQQLDQLTYEYNRSLSLSNFDNTVYAITKLLVLSDQANTPETQGTINWLIAAQQLYDNSSTPANVLLRQTAIQSAWQDSHTAINDTQINAYITTTVDKFIQNVLQTHTIDLNQLFQQDKSNLATLGIQANNPAFQEGLINTLSFAEPYISPAVLTSKNAETTVAQYNQWLSDSTNLTPIDAAVDSDGDLIPDSLDTDPYVADNTLVQAQPLLGSATDNTKLGGFGTVEGPTPLAITPPPLPPRDPLSFDLNDDGKIGTLSKDNGVYFDLDNSGFAEKTAWIAPEDGLLVLDRNNNNKIDGGAELFGTETLLKNGNYATNGYIALDEFDDNNDNQITKEDAIFSQLKIWQDKNHNGISEADELKSLDQLGIVNINTTYNSQTTRDANGVEHRENSLFTDINGNQKVTNTLWFSSDRTNSIPVDINDGANFDIPYVTAALPNAIGFGNVYSLQEAMAKDTTGKLQALVTEFSQETDVANRLTLVEQILLYWTGQEDIDPKSRGTAINAQHVAVMEMFWGQPAFQQNPTGVYAQRVETAYSNLFNSVYAQLLTQTHYSSFYNMIDFENKDGNWTADFDKLGNYLVTLFATDPLQYQNVIAEFLFAMQGINPQNPTFYKGLIQSIEDHATHLDPAVSTLLYEVIRHGNDDLTGTAQADIIRGFDGNDIIHGGDNDDLLIGNTGNDSLYGGNGNDTLSGNEGQDTLYGDNGNDTLLGDDGQDTLFGGKGDDTLQGGQGNDRLEGGEGNDTYRYKKGDGSDTILNFDPTTGRNDTLKLEDINPQQVTAIRRDDNLILILNDGNRLVVENYFIADANGGYALDNIQFADGTTWNIDTVKYIVQQGTAGDDMLYGYAIDDTLQGLAGNDVLYGNGGSDTLIGGQGNDRLEGGGGNDTYLYKKGDGSDTIYNFDLTTGRNDTLKLEDIAPQDVIAVRRNNDLILKLSDGSNITLANYFIADANGGYAMDNIQFADGVAWNIDNVKYIVQQGTADDDMLYGYAIDDTLQGLAGNDTLYGNGGSDILIGGLGNDRLEGGDGSDTYVYNKGDGNDSIVNRDYSPGHNDTLELQDINADEAKAIRQGDNLVIALADGSNITVEGYFIEDGNGGYAINTVKFADGTAWDIDTIKTMVQQGTEGNDTLYGYAVSDVLQGLAGNDTLYGNGGSDTLIGGQGNDRLEGGDGSDTYIYHKGDGSDIIINRDFSAGRNDTLKFADINANEVQATRQGDHLVIKLSDGSNVTVDNYFMADANGGYAINQVQFADGTTWNIDTVKTLVQQGTEGNDTLYGYATDDTLQGLAGDDTFYGNGGNDTLVGGLGNDTYLYWQGQGNDTIINTASDAATSIDTVRLMDVYPDSVNLIDDDGDLVIRINTNNQTIRVEGYFKDTSSQIDKIMLADGTVWTPEYIESHAIRETEGDDIIIGSIIADVINAKAGNDTITGSKGNDTINGGTGNDTYIFNLGDGHDTIIDTNLELTVPNTDTIKFGNGISKDSLQITRTGNDLSFVVDANNSVTVKDWFVSDNNWIEKVEFSNGQSISIDNLKKMNITGRFGSADDIIQGWDGIDTLLGNDGDDKLYGKAGNDTLIGGSGNDLLDGGAGADTLIGGKGDDTYVIDANDKIVEELSGLMGGFDTVISSANVDIGNTNLEGIELSGSENLRAIGNEANNVIVGNTGNNYIDGGLGKDTMRGGAGDDYYVVEQYATLVNNADGSNALIEGDQVIETFIDGDNILDAGGNDTIERWVDKYEFATDASGKYYQTQAFADLETNVENLILKGSATAGYGNALDNTIVLNSLSNIVDAKAGNDTVIYQRGGGHDTLYFSDVTTAKDSLVLQGYNENEVKLVRAGNDLIINFINQPNDQITLKDHFAVSPEQAAANSDNKVDNIVFDNGKVWQTSYIDYLGNGGKPSQAPTTNNPALTLTPTEAEVFSYNLNGNFKDADGDKLTYQVVMQDGSAVPTWLTINPTTGIISGTPPIGADNLSLKVTANDPAGFSTAATITLNIKDNLAPIVQQPLPSLTAIDAKTFNLNLNLYRYKDPEGKPLSFSLSQLDESQLPSWVTFNSTTGTLSGKAPLGTDSLTLKLTATDAAGLATTETIAINFADNQAPKISQPLQNITAIEAVNFSQNLNLGRYTDPEGEALSYTLTQQDGSALPTWLTFNTKTGVISGTSPLNTLDNIKLLLTVTDEAGLTAKENVVINFNDNKVPQLVSLVQDIVVTSNNYFAALTPRNNFMDPEGLGLKFNITQMDGTPVPDWLKFDTQTGQIYGYAPTNANSLALKITAIDQAGQSVSDNFTLTTNEPPKINTVLDNTTVLQGQPFEYVIPLTKITDPEGGKLTLMVTTANGTDLPSWLNFDATTGKLVGTAPLDYSNNLPLLLKVTDQYGATTTQSFNLAVQINQAPQLLQANDDYVVAEGATFTTTLDLSHFKDPEGSKLVYKLTTVDGSAIPSWLSFDAQTGKVIGNPPIGATSTDLLLTATDNVGLSVADSFTLQVTAKDLNLTAPAFGGEIVGQSGNDVLNGSWFNDTLIGNKGNDKLFGSLGADNLVGGEGDDLLDGGSGADAMTGGKGNDTFIVENGNDVVKEFANEGVDTVQSYIGYTLTDNVENLQLMGILGNNGTGNDLDNILTGNSGFNVLMGLGGNDLLIGGKGNDTLIGGIGNDTYSYTVGDGYDSLQDSQGSDTLVIHGNLTSENVVFARQDNNLVITLKNNTGSMTVDGWFSDMANQVETIQLDSGASLNSASISTLFMGQTTYEQSLSHTSNQWII